MTVSKLVGSLLEQQQAEMEKRLEAHRKEHDQKVIAAAAYDEHVQGRELPMPRHVLVSSGVFFTFERVKPDELIAMMDIFPPVPSGLRKGNSGTSVIPADRVKEGDTFSTGDGFWLNVDDRLQMKWYTELAGKVRVQLWAELDTVYGVHPQRTARIIQDATGRICRIENATVTHPLAQPAGVHLIRYGQHALDAWPHMLLWGTGMRQMAEAWRAECTQRGIATMEAYLRDKAAGVEPEPPNDRPGRFHAGTPEQEACIDTLEARMDMALARKHWDAYVKDRSGDPWPVKQSEYTRGFDHYAWACNWLALHNLYEVPLEGRDKPYRYGSAWL